MSARRASEDTAPEPGRAGNGVLGTFSIEGKESAVRQRFIFGDFTGVLCTDMGLGAATFWLGVAISVSTDAAGARGAPPELRLGVRVSPGSGIGKLLGVRAGVATGFGVGAAVLPCRANALATLSLISFETGTGDSARLSPPFFPMAASSAQEAALQPKIG